MLQNEIDNETHSKMRFITFIITMFARAYKMNKQQAFLYLEKYGGLDYLFKHWWTLHTEDLYWSLKALYSVCYKNGGLKYYLNKKISKEQFLKELTHKTPTHQICFCTLRSLQALELHKEKNDVETIHIDNEIVQSLIAEQGLTEMEAVKIYYTSNTYAQLSDDTSGLYQKTWFEIYEMLKKEIKSILDS